MSRPLLLGWVALAVFSVSQCGDPSDSDPQVEVAADVEVQEAAQDAEIAEVAPETDGGGDADIGEAPACELQLGICEGSKKPASLYVDGAWLACDAAAYLAFAPGYDEGQEERCDGLDNDCDGEVDEDFILTLLSGDTVSGIGQGCGLGACAGGVTECRDDASGVECPTETLAGLETCNLEDDDCDGGTDEDVICGDGEPCAEAGLCLAGSFCNDDDVCEKKPALCSDAEDPDGACAGACNPLSYCETCVCDMDAKVCVKNAVTGEDCCVTSEDCDDGNIVTYDICEQPGGPCSHPPDLSVCPLGLNKKYYHADFDQGSLNMLDVTYDNNPDDAVAWQVDGTDPAKGAYALYFGDVACHTYYTGALDGDCQPVDLLQTDAAAVAGHVRTTDITLGGSDLEDACIYSLTFWARFEGEPTWQGLEPATPDQLRIFVIYGVDEEEIFASAIATEENNTGGEWRQFAADLSPWWGQTIRIEFQFDSYDDKNNFFFGVMLDDIIVRSVPGANQCGGDSDCPDDGLTCTDDACTFFVNGSENAGLCAYFIPDDDCHDCNSDADCNQGGDCAAGACVDTVCEFELDVACCEANLIQVAKKWDFEAGLGAWEVTEASGEDVTWQAVPSHGAGDSAALYFGDRNKPCPNDASAICPSYDNGDAVSATVASEEIILQPGAAFRMLTFDLWMSTEWDGTPLNEFVNQINADRLTLYVESEGARAEVWNSDMTGGSTYELDEDGLIGIGWETIGVDVTAFKGKAVRFLFVFDSGEYLENDHEGIYIDQVSLLVACAPPCASAADCFDDLVCTDEVCVAGICEYDAIGTCCETVDACGDDDECTADLCQGGLCAWAYSTDPSCCTEGPVDASTYAFEGDALADGLEVVVPEGSKVTWQLADRPKGEGRALWFGNAATGTYQNPLDTGTEAPAVGSLSFPEIPLPTGGVPVLEFDLYLETEWAGNTANWEFPAADVSFDKLSVFVNDALVWDSFVYEVAGSTCGTGACDFVPVRISLADYSGQSATIRFAFDSLEVGPGFDGSGDNSFAGAFVDDLQIYWHCAAVDCYSSKDCSDEPEPGAGPAAPDDSCTKDKCLDSQCFFEATGRPGCCYPQDKQTDGFEDGTSAIDLAGQSGSVKWQILATQDGARAHSGNKSLYFGNPATMSYEDSGESVGNEASLSLAIDPEPDLTLEWYQWLGLDAADHDVFTADKFRVSLIDLANGAEQVELFSNKPSYAYYEAWRRVAFDLTPYAGKQVILRFEFQSGDPSNNDAEGIYLDDLRIYKGCD